MTYPVVGERVRSACTTVGSVGSRCAVAVAWDRRARQPLAATPCGVLRVTEDGAWHPAGGWTGLAQVIAPDAGDSPSVWAGTADGLLALGPDRARWEVILATSVSAVARAGTAGAALAASAQDGIFRSDDAGRSWRSSSAGLLDLRVNDVALDPEHIDRVIAATRSGVWLSANGGCSWHRDDSWMCGQEPLWVAYAGDWPLVATDNALFIAAATGWQAILETDQPITGISADPGGQVAVAHGMSVTIKRTDDLWKDLSPVPSACLDVTSDDDGNVFVATQRHGVVRLDAGGNWREYATGFPTTATGRLVNRRRELYWADASGSDLVSRDLGRSWTPSPHRVGNEMAAEMGDLTMATTTLDRPVSRIDRWGTDLIVVSDQDTADGRESTLLVGPQAEGPWRPLLTTSGPNPIIFHVHAVDLFVAVGGVVLHADRRTDRTLREVARFESDQPGLGQHVILDLAADGNGCLYAATTGGIAMSTDKGSSWALHSTHNLPVVSVVTVAGQLVAVDVEGNVIHSRGPGCTKNYSEESQCRSIG